MFSFERNECLIWSAWMSLAVGHYKTCIPLSVNIQVLHTLTLSFNLHHIDKDKLLILHSSIDIKTWTFFYNRNLINFYHQNYLWFKWTLNNGCKLPTIVQWFCVCIFVHAFTVKSLQIVLIFNAVWFDNRSKSNATQLIDCHSFNWIQ